MPKKTKTVEAAPPACVMEAGDCVELLARRFGKKEAEKAKLGIFDPPYNIGQEYDSHDDSKPKEEFWEWTEVWLRAAAGSLDPRGSMFVFIPDEWVSEVDVFCKRELKLFKRSHIVWYYTFGQCNSEGKGLSRSHTHILYFTKKKTIFTWNREAVAVPSARQLVYGDKRANPNGKAADNTWMLLKGEMERVFEPDQDTWLENRVCGTYRARQKGSPNQIPVPLLERMVRMASDPGDLVIDCFLGSGSTALACRMHGRRFWGCDVSPKYVANAQKRIAAWQSG